MLADRRIVDQTDAQFELVYDTKVKGLSHLFEAIDPESLAFLVLFSSSTARFGRTGQVAYAAANEALNKWAQQQAARLPDCRVVSYNWGPWAGGMVKDALRPLFEKEGLQLIPPADGARLVVEDLRADVGLPVEIVVLADHVGLTGRLIRRGPRRLQPARPTGQRCRRRPPRLRSEQRIGSSRPCSAARSTSSRCRSSRRTSSTGTPCCRWRSCWNGWPRGQPIATRAWWFAGSIIFASSRG